MSAPTCLLDLIAVRPRLSTEVSKPSPTIPRTSTIDVRHKVSLTTPSFSTQTVTFSPRFHRPSKCCFHHHRPSTPVTRWVFTFSTQAVDFYPGFAALCRAEFWLVDDLLQHVFRTSPTFLPHRQCWLLIGCILVSTWVSYFTHHATDNIYRITDGNNILRIFKNRYITLNINLSPFWSLSSFPPQ